MTTRNDKDFRSAVLETAERTQEQLIRYTSRFFAGDQDAARDVVQHAFLQLCRAEPDKRPEKLNQWLYRVCRNRAIDMQRDRKRLQTGSQQAVSLQLDASVSSFEALSAAEFSEIVRQRLATLPEAQGEAIDLWSVGLRYAEISSVMDRPESSIRVLVHRGLSKLRSDPAIRRWLFEEDESTAGSKESTTVPETERVTLPLGGSGSQARGGKSDSALS